MRPSNNAASMIQKTNEHVNFGNFLTDSLSYLSLVGNFLINRSVSCILSFIKIYCMSGKYRETILTKSNVEN